MSSSEFNKEFYDEKIRNIEKESDEHEKRIKALEKIYITIEKMATELVELRKSTNEISQRLNLIEQEPANKWKNITSYILTAIVGAIVTYVLVKIGLK